jgi:hypothetical protein
MTKQLKPRNLDIVITKITDKTVYYELAANRASENWRIPSSSTFDKSTLVVGERYAVMTRVIRSLQWDHKAQNQIYKDTYDWVYAQHRAPKAKCTVKAKRNGPDLPLADEGALFTW